METNITKEVLQHITKRIISEVLDILKSEISVIDDNLSDYGLDIDLVSKYA